MFFSFVVVVVGGGGVAYVVFVLDVGRNMCSSE